MNTSSAIEPGGCCPFAGGTCQEGCWAWNLDGSDGCAALGWPDEGESPRDYYNRMLVGLGD